MIARVVQRSWQPVLTCVAGVGCGVGVGVVLKGSWQPGSRQQQQQQQQQGGGLWGVVACDEEVSTTLCQVACSACFTL